MKNAMIIDSKDNVAVAIEKIEKGTAAIFEKNNKIIEIMVTDEIPMYHKVAIENIKKGSHIVKYGEYIGVAKSDINKGMHVHTHNVLSVREKVTD